MTSPLTELSIVVAADNGVLKWYNSALSAATSVSDRTRKDSAVSIVSRTHVEQKQSWKVRSETEAAQSERLDATVLSALPTSDSTTQFLTAHSQPNPKKTEGSKNSALWLHSMPVTQASFSSTRVWQSEHPIMCAQAIHSTKSVFLATENGEFRTAVMSDAGSFDVSSPVASLSRPVTRCHVSIDGQPSIVVLGQQGTLPCVLSAETCQPIWKAKSLGNDSLNMTIPMWDKDVTWVRGSSTLFAVATAYGQLRVYDARESRRKPVINFELQEELAKDESVGKHQRMTRRENLFALNRVSHNQWHSGAGLGFCVGSNKGHLYVVDTRVASSSEKSKVNFRLKGFQGAIRDIRIHDDIAVIAACGLDRHVRLFDLKTFAPVGTIYSKLPLSCIGFVDTSTQSTRKDNSPDDVNDSEEDDEAEWTRLTQVQEKRAPASKAPPAKRRKTK